MSPRRFLVVWIASAIALLVTCGLTGRLHHHTVNDTASYSQYDWSSRVTVASQTRMPGYPLIVRCVAWMTPTAATAFQSIVVIQVTLHALAVSLFAGELAHRHAPTPWILVMSTVLAVCPTFWDHVNTIATDSPAMSVGIIVATMVLRSYRLHASFRDDLIIGAIALIAITLRPAYLFLIPWLVLVTLFPPASSPTRVIRQRLTSSALVVAVPLSFILVWCSFRWVAVNDFGLLPFGHQNMAAVTTQLLDADELRDLPGESGQLGALIADRRIVLSRSRDGRLDVSAADGLDLRPTVDAASRADSTMTLESRWDAMTYLVVIPAAAQIANSPIQQHRRLADLDRMIVSRYPARYLRWVLLAIRRGIWGGLANIAMHPVYLSIGCIVGAAIWCCTVTGSTSRLIAKRSARWDSKDLFQGTFTPITLISLTYAMTSIGFVALTSPLIGRFSDAAMALVPVWLAIVLITLVVVVGASSQDPVSPSIQREA
ncbi:MAG: hypothetical protein AAGC97_18415 [Planctomycetota bacterium]